MKDFESLTVISIEQYCKVNPAWFTFKNDYQLKTLKFQKVIKCNQLHYSNKAIEKLHYLLHFN